jgi:hypothetical protein
LAKADEISTNNGYQSNSWNMHISESSYSSIV